MYFMSDLFLNRLTSDLFTTFGVFMYENKPVCYSLELPWRDNRRNVSCIPSGRYGLSRSFSSRHGSVFLLHGVPGRSEILIHTGNYVGDTEGCILPGLDINAVGVVYSRVALRRLLGIPETVNFLTIKDSFT
jgi:hypothetical protein